MRSTSMKVMAAALLVVSGLALGASPAGAGIAANQLNVEPDTTDRQVGRWDFGRAEPNGLECLSPSYTVFGEGGPVDEDLYEIETELLDPVTGSLTATGLPAGFYELLIECEQSAYSGGVVFGRLTVTKVVEGDAPDDATFVVEVDCTGGDPFTEELEYGADGGVAEVFIYDGPTVCAVTETDDGGAESSEVEDGTADFEDPIDLASTVTNTFGETPPTTTTTTTTTVPTTTTTTPPVPAPAPAPAPSPVAQAAQATPRFVG